MRKKKIPLGTAIELLVIGLLLGSVFCFGTPHWYKDVPREECIQIETQLLKYKQITSRHGNVEIRIDCTNGEQYFIDRFVGTSELAEKTAKIVHGEDITLLLHPNSDHIMELSTNSETILPFSVASERTRYNATGFFHIGLFLYFCALLGAYCIVRNCIEKRIQ